MISPPFFGHKRIAWSISISLGMAAMFGFAPVWAGKILNDAMLTFPFRHHSWQSVLTQCVTSEGYVDLANLRANPARLTQYMAQLEQVSPDNMSEAFPTREDKMAYWVNAHNALALRLLLDAFPVETLAQIPNLGDTHRYAFGGKVLSLLEIRQKIATLARLQPALLLAVTDFSEQSPPVSSQAFEGSTLQAQLKIAFSQQLSSLVRIEHHGQCNTVELSAFLATYQKELLAPSPGQLEEQPSTLEPGFLTVSNQGMGWLEWLRGWLPSEKVALLRYPCSVQPAFFEGEARLRLVGPE